MKQALRRWVLTVFLCGVIAGLPAWAQAEMARYNVDLDHSIIGF